jgi:hypothetical protein
MTRLKFFIALLLLVSLLPLRAAENIKSVDGVAKANLKSISGVSEANIKSIEGVDNTSASPFSGLVATTSMAAHWKLNEASGSRADSFGANTLTDNNTVVAGTGKIGDGSDIEASSSEFLSIADNAELSLAGDTDFTIACWIKPETIATSAILSKRTGTTSTATEYSLFLIVTTGVIRFDVGNGVSGTSLSSVEAASVGNWRFIVAWHDTTANKLFLQIDNGTPNEVAHTLGTQNTTSELHIGKTPNSSSNFFDGVVDSVSIWKRTLTSGERTALYNSGNGLDY